MNPVRLQTAPTGPGENIELPKYLVNLHDTSPTAIGDVFGVGFPAGNTQVKHPYENCPYIFRIYHKRRRTLEKIRELVSLLESGIEDYDAQLKVLQTERLKYIRLSMTDGFGTEEADSKESWLLHLKQLEDSLRLRLNSIQQAIREAAEDIQKEENA